MAVRTRIEELDALRGVAALVVFFHHLFVLAPQLFEPVRAAPLLYATLQLVSAQNKNAVLAFFVLSGFSIRLSMHEDSLFAAGGIADYARRRAARILPLYWISLALTWGLGFVYGNQDQSFSSWNLLGNLAFLQTSEATRGGWFSPYGLNGPYWSLSYEAFYYLAMPLCWLAIGRSRAWDRRWLNGFLVGSLGVSLGALAAGLWTPNPILSFLALWHVWVYGFVLADAYLRPRSGWIFATPIVVVAAVAAALAVLNLHSATLQLLVAGIVTGSVFAAVLYYREQVPSAVSRTASRVLRGGFLRIGRGSYALYLLHYPVLLALAQALVPGRDVGEQVWIVALGGVVLALMITVGCPWLEGALRGPGRRLFGVGRRRFPAAHSIPATSPAASD